MRWLSEQHDVIAVDTETDGLNRRQHKIRLIQIGDANDGWAIPWDMWGGVAMEALTKYEGRMVFHNAKFDVGMLEQWTSWRAPRHKLDDTMVMAHVLDSTRPVGLKVLTSLLIDRRAAQMQTILDEGMTNNGWTWATVPLDYSPYWQYAALDTVLTARLYELFWPQIAAECPKAYDLEMAMTWVALGMERKGCQIDVAFTQEKLAAFMRFVEQSEDWCVENYGVKPGSNVPVIQRLQEDGIEFTARTKSGALSLDKEVLEGIIAATGHPLADTVFQRRRIQKLASTYLKNFLELVDEDGRIRPNVRVLGARTGRMSITNPALQTLPRRSESNPAAIAVRNCITASEGSTLVSCDLDQIEARLTAHFSNDPGMLVAFETGDFFTTIAQSLYHDPTLEKKDPRRQLCKNATYALTYGAGPEKIALTAGQPIEIVQEFLNRLALQFPGIKQFQRQVADVAAQRKTAEGAAYVRSPLTNRKLVADDGKEYALVNFLIQSTSCEYFKMKNVEMASAGLDEYMILDVHDEVVADVPNELVDEVEHTIQQIMSDDTMFRVPITAGCAQSYRWGDAK